MSIRVTLREVTHDSAVVQLFVKKEGSDNLVAKSVILMVGEDEELTVLSDFIKVSVKTFTGDTPDLSLRNIS